jgi:alanyl-tRNA synthetase
MQFIKCINIESCSFKINYTFHQKEICSWAWEFLTVVLKLPADQLYVTYFGGDEKAKLEPDLECKNFWLSLG